MVDCGGICDACEFVIRSKPELLPANWRWGVRGRRCTGHPRDVALSGTLGDVHGSGYLRLSTVHNLGSERGTLHRANDDHRWTCGCSTYPMQWMGRNERAFFSGFEPDLLQRDPQRASIGIHG